MLNEMRFGTLSGESIKIFKSLASPKDYNDGIDPTELFPTRREVDEANEKRMRALGGEKVKFNADDWVNPEEPRFDNKEHADLSNMMVPNVLELKVNAQVMLLKNLDADLVNGTIGKVIGFGYPDPEDEEMDELMRAQSGIEGDFKPGKPMMPKAKVGPNGVAELPPRVEWTCINGLKRVMTMEREEFKTENTKGQKRVHRKQVSDVRSRA
jgi:ATP-dependent DNA helicase PIF1